MTLSIFTPELSILLGIINIGDAATTPATTQNDSSDVQSLPLPMITLGNKDLARLRLFMERIDAEGLPENFNYRQRIDFHTLPAPSKDTSPKDLRRMFRDGFLNALEAEIAWSMLSRKISPIVMPKNLKTLEAVSLWDRGLAISRKNREPDKAIFPLGSTSFWQREFDLDLDPRLQAIDPENHPALVFASGQAQDTSLRLPVNLALSACAGAMLAWRAAIIERVNDDKPPTLAQINGALNTLTADGGRGLPLVLSGSRFLSESEKTVLRQEAAHFKILLDDTRQSDNDTPKNPYTFYPSPLSRWIQENKRHIRSREKRWITVIDESLKLETIANIDFPLIPHGAEAFMRWADSGGGD